MVSHQIVSRVQISTRPSSRLSLRYHWNICRLGGIHATATLGSSSSSSSKSRRSRNASNMALMATLGSAVVSGSMWMNCCAEQSENKHVHAVTICQKTDTMPRGAKPNMPAKNIMLHRLRSVRARDMNDKYVILWEKVLGEGAYGSVHPAYDINTGEKVALKKISKRFTNNKNFKTETDALLRIFDNGGHPNISGLRDMYEDFNSFFLIMDLVKGGEMFDHLVNYGPYSEADAARLMQEVASALAFLHGVGVVHADLKPENLLICSSKTTDGTIKIIDFGSAVVSHDNYHDDDDDDDDDESAFVKSDRSKKKAQDIEMRPQKKKSVLRENPGEEVTFSTGTTAYWSPERFRVKGAQTGADMWSVGVILYIMLTGVHPFDLQGMSTDEEIEDRIKSDPRVPIHPRITGHLSASAIDLIKKLMEPDHTKRLSANGMLKHSWIR